MIARAPTAAGLVLLGLAADVALAADHLLTPRAERWLVRSVVATVVVAPTTLLVAFPALYGWWWTTALGLAGGVVAGTSAWWWIDRRSRLAGARTAA